MTVGTDSDSIQAMIENIKCAHHELVELHRLQPNPRNPNSHPKEQIKLLSKLIDFQGQRLPIIVSNRSGFLVAGHGRLEALKLLGWEKAAVDFQDFQNEAQELAFMVSDNKIQELAESDDALIQEIARDLGDLDLDLLGIPDFELINIDQLAGGDPDAVPELPSEAKTKLGDVYRLGKHRLMCGDSTSIDAVEKLMAGEKADMVFTDPPYKLTSGGDSGIGKGMFKATAPEYKNSGLLFEVPEFKDWVCILYCALKTNADIYAMSNDKNLSDLMNAMGTAEIRTHNILVMGKNTHAPNRWYLKNCEFVFYGFLGSAKAINNMGSFALQNVDMPQGKLHQSQKPVEYIEGLICNSSDQLGIVFEPFGGSGSTLIACEKTNRKCFMMELDPKYCDVIVKRWEDFTGKKAELLKSES